MANTTVTTNNNQSNNFVPTGVVNIVSGLTNPIAMAAQANQQINVGDAIIQNNSSNAFTALPAYCLSVVGDTSNAASNAALQLSVAQNFAGFSLGYRSRLNTSSGKNSDRIGVATGRMKLAVNPAAATAYGNATGIGQLWGVATTQNNQYNGTSTPLANNSWVLPNLYDTVATANLAIGRQALPKAANEPYVWVDAVSRLVASGVQSLGPTGA
jgi:hypothetical protein